MNYRTPIKLVIIVCVLIFAPTLRAESGQYGRSFRFKENQSVEFPDFELLFQGQSPGAFYPNSNRRLAPVFEFKVKSKNDTQSVRWSSGTGMIGPVFFTVDQNCYRIELSRSDKLGKLADDEALVSTDQYEYCRPNS